MVPLGIHTAGVDFAGGSAGSVREAHAAATSAATAAVHTAPRHPATPASAASGRPAAKAPSCTPDCFIPVTDPRRAGGTAARIALLVAGLARACGSPPRATATSRNPVLGADPISASAAADASRRATRQRRGPTRSTTRPPSGDRTAAAAKPTVVVRPSTVGETCSSSERRGPSAPSRNSWSMENAMADVSNAVMAPVAVPRPGMSSAPPRPPPTAAIPAPSSRPRRTASAVEAPSEVGPNAPRVPAR